MCSTHWIWRLSIKTQLRRYRYACTEQPEFVLRLWTTNIANRILSVPLPGPDQWLYNIKVLLSPSVPFWLSLYSPANGGTLNWLSSNLIYKTFITQALVYYYEIAFWINFHLFTCFTSDLLFFFFFHFCLCPLKFEKLQINKAEKTKMTVWTSSWAIKCYHLSFCNTMKK